jgi:hypothetical protein
MGICSSKEAEDKEDELTEADIDKIKAIFTYENMVQYLIEQKTYPVMYDEKKKFGASVERAFIGFGYMDNIKESDVGWKAHIAIDDSDKTNLANAWNVVKDIFIEEKLLTKVVNPSANFFKDESQCGKQITIYCFVSPNVDWERVFNKIEDALFNANINNHKFSPGEKEIPGSRYLSYRNDSDKDGNYVYSSNDYNPAGFSDPFQNIELEPRGNHFRL